MLVTKPCLTLQSHGLQTTRLLCLWNSPEKNTGVGSCSLFQGIFLTQRLNPGLLHYRQILYHLSFQGILFNTKNSPKSSSFSSIPKILSYFHFYSAQKYFLISPVASSSTYKLFRSMFWFSKYLWIFQVSLCSWFSSLIIYGHSMYSGWLQFFSMC